MIICDPNTEPKQNKMRHIIKRKEKIKWPILAIAFIAGIITWFIPMNISPEAHAVFAVIITAGILSTMDLKH